MSAVEREELERAAFRAGFEAAMQFANYPRSYDERDFDQFDIDQAFRHWGNTA